MSDWKRIKRLPDYVLMSFGVWAVWRAWDAAGIGGLLWMALGWAFVAALMWLVILAIGWMRDGPGAPPYL
jgi:hypothetical protein